MTYRIFKRGEVCIIASVGTTGLIEAGDDIRSDETGAAGDQKHFVRPLMSSLADGSRFLASAVAGAQDRAWGFPGLFDLATPSPQSPQPVNTSVNQALCPF